MPKIGRNDPCPCGSGKKYKKCCQNQSISGVEPRYIAVEEPLDLESNRILSLIRQNQFEEAEQAALKFIINYPDVNDGFDRLGMLYEKQGKKTLAIDMYQKALDFTLGKDGYDEEGRDYYRDKIDLLRK